ncbi:acetolactate synthase I/III small subunit [Candidatus Hakubella thermalkaliphila]|uniref:Acetolactate synthase small subunit n=3 Tax=Candidatus Hakubella thermalkaliphila TaxID=2754717 RepID=A0A6V8PYY5_9ACTN|nr:Acetolactate synthase small subunit [Actinomycetota bacterium]GFP18519.1 acetolactate synthase I/III small subunit [Candidatus Hakubella thermalkaliphila]GFP21217.1 acetolactate synthase I/III small subunit [Candidatus Hakubella thermalkaliphila]GFP27064.1 acetolactate synthase I/III small subunit [Candidatus Hakubella thermalkaliphila]GFP35700.1 acetolactate synthase I/III small subunit [Candidatus Hakubella thermalkaliphila]
MMVMKHTLSVLVENKPGVLAKISGLFSRRGFNIDSLAVGPTEDETISRMTIVVESEDRSLEQVTKQLHKLISVIKIQDLDPENMIERELILIKVNTEPDFRPEILEIVDIFRAKIVDVSPKSLVIEITGTTSKLEAMEELLRPYGIMELVRTGRIAISRGIKAVRA